MSDTALVIMARYPENGKTKTRLARSIGYAEATSLYCAFLTDLALRFTRHAEFDLFWAYTPPEANFCSLMASLVPELGQHIKGIPQEGPDLGTRLHNVFRQTKRREFEQTIVISSDTPQLSIDAVLNARKALNETDVVLGPAEDGGYYLIAMRYPHDVFSNIPMSTSAVREMTIELAKQQSLTIHQLELLFDIDELPDLFRLAELLQKDSSLAPATAAYLESIRSFYDAYNNIDRYSAPLDLH